MSLINFYIKESYYLKIMQYPRAGIFKYREMGIGTDC